jgi:two-component system phosphate regulon sensor histidine kinase PhoR
MNVTKSRFEFHSLRAQIISSSIILVLLTAVIAGLPALWIIRDQLDHQAWAQIEQGYSAAQSLYDSQKSQITGFANLIAQRPLLAEMLRQGDASALESYLRALQTNEKIDLIAICDQDQQVRVQTGTSQVIDHLCDPRNNGSFYLVQGTTIPQVWLMASQSLDASGGITGTVLVGQKLDNDFATQMHSQTGLEHSIIAGDQVVATSLSAPPPVQTTLSPRPSYLVAPDILVCCTYELSDQSYYAARLPLDGSSLQAEIALPVTAINATLWTLGVVLAGSILLVAVFGSVIAVIRARQISKPLVSLVDAATRFSRGDLAAPVQAESQVREVVQLSQALEQARLDLSSTLMALQAEKSWVDRLLASIVEGIITLDANNRITFFSHGAERITGWMKAEALHRHCDELFHIAEGDTAFSQCIPSPGQKNQLVIQVSGRRNVVLSITRAQRNASIEEQPEVVLVFRDVSEEVTIHRLLGYFIANIAHEFRTPLSALAASIELLMDQAPDFSTAEVDELLKSLHLGVLSLQTLVDNLLESASIEAGHFRVSPRPYDLDKIIQEAITTMQPLMDKYGQCLTLEINEPLPVVLADPRRIAQVLVNLISNAIRYGAERGEITLKASVGKDQVTVQVADRGPGVSSDQRELLFRRFEYPAADGTHNKVGAGLGLSVVKAIVEAHGGRTGMDDRPGGGSVFWFTLPTADDI